MGNIIENSIRDSVIRELGIGAADMAGSVSRYHNQVMREIAAYHRWSWMEELPIPLTTESGQTYITKPDYMGDIKAIYQDSGGVEISRISETGYARQMALSDSSSRLSVHFIEQGGRLYFWPPLTAGSSVEVISNINPEQFVDDASTPVSEALSEIIPASFSLIIEWGILRCMDIEEKKDGWANRYYNELEIKRKQAIRSAAPKVKATLGASIDGMNRHFITR